MNSFFFRKMYFFLFLVLSLQFLIKKADFSDKMGIFCLFYPFFYCK